MAFRVKKDSRKSSAKFVEGEKVWIDVPGYQGKVCMSVENSSQDPSTGKWSYELKDSGGNTYYQKNNKWILEKDLEGGHHVASASKDETMQADNTQTEPFQNILRGHSGWVTAVVFSPDGRLIASASRHEAVRLWNTQTGFLQSVLQGHSGYVTAVTFSPDGQLIASASRDGTVRLWNVQTGSSQSISEGQDDSSKNPGLLSRTRDDTSYRPENYNISSQSRRHMVNFDQQSSTTVTVDFTYTQKYSCEGLQFLKTLDEINDISIVLKPNPEGHYYVATHLSKAL